MTKNPGADAALQNEQIRELIEADVDAVFLSPVDQEEITPASWKNFRRRASR